MADIVILQQACNLYETSKEIWDIYIYIYIEDEMLKLILQKDTKLSYNFYQFETN